MDNEEIIRMAREAELYSYLWGGDINQQSLETLERFAALVAAHEREACACLFEIEQELSEWPKYILEQCAAAIRARSEK